MKGTGGICGEKGVSSSLRKGKGGVRSRLLLMALGRRRLVRKVGHLVESFGRFVCVFNGTGKIVDLQTLSRDGLGNKCNYYYGWLIAFLAAFTSRTFELIRSDVRLRCCRHCLGSTDSVICLQTFERNW